MYIATDSLAGVALMGFVLIAGAVIAESSTYTQTWHPLVTR